MNTLSLPRVDLHAIQHPEIASLGEAFERYRIRLEVLDMTTDIKIPSMLALVVDETSDRGPAVCLGAKVDTDPLWAIRGAIEEVWHALGGARWIAENERESIFRKWRFDEIRDPLDHFRFWGRPSMRQHIQFFLRGRLQRYRGPNQFRRRNAKNQLVQVIRALHQAGMRDVIFRDLTVPPLASKGFRVVSTFVPGLVHMYLNENMRATGNSRLRTAPTNMGYKPAEVLNPIPHPFA